MYCILRAWGGRPSGRCLLPKRNKGCQRCLPVREERKKHGEGKAVRSVNASPGKSGVNAGRNRWVCTSFLIKKKDGRLCQYKAKERWAYGTPGDNESFDHHAYQHVNRVCRADGTERNDSFDPSCWPDKKQVISLYLLYVRRGMGVKVLVEVILNGTSGYYESFDYHAY